MYWTTGFHSATPGGSPLYVPRDAQPQGVCASGIWNVGQTVRQLAHNDLTLIVLGNCMASDSELRRSLDGEQVDWLSLMLWPGAYAVVVQGRDCTRISGSLSGTIRVYYAAVAGGYQWSTAASPLAAHVGGGVDLGLLASNFVVDDIDDEATPFHDVAAVPLGSYLCLSAGSVRIKKWYRPIRYDSVDAAASTFRRALLMSIERRAALEPDALLCGDLSGGYDSSAIMAIARRHRPVLGVTLAGDMMSNEDVQYARLVAKVCSMQHRIVGCDGVVFDYSDLGGANALATDLPASGLSTAKLSRTRLLQAKERSNSHYLTGFGGDNVLGVTSTYLTDLFMDGLHLRAVREAYASARRNAVPAWKMVRAMRSEARGSYAGSLMQAADMMQSGETPLRESQPWTQVQRLNVSSTLRWLTPDGRRQAAERLAAYAHRCGDQKPGDISAWRHLRKEATKAVAAYMTAQGEVMGVTVEKPFLDAAVVRAALSLPSYERYDSAQPKPLLVKAVGDLLPSGLTARTTKATGTHHACLGMRKNEKLIRGVIKRSPLVDAGMLDFDAVARDLNRAANGLPASISQLDNLIATSPWLGALNIRRDQWWRRTV